MKKFLLILMSLLILLSFAGCGGKSEDVSIDIDTLSNNIAENGEFDDAISQIGEDIAKGIYDAGDEVKCSAYAGTGATPEQIAVFETGSEDDAKTLKDNLDGYLEDQISQYSSYLPEQVPKLEDAYLEAKGKYVILCVSKNSQLVGEIVEDVLTN